MIYQALFSPMLCLARIRIFYVLIYAIKYAQANSFFLLMLCVSNDGSAGHHKYVVGIHPYVSVFGDGFK